MNSWPEIIKEDLWPYAIRVAVDFHHAPPGISGLSPKEILVDPKDTITFMSFILLAVQSFFWTLNFSRAIRFLNGNHAIE
jgi:hypothetical protein